MVLGAIGETVETPAMSAGRREELGFLFREHYPAMVRLAYLLTSDRAVAEDIAQEAFVRTWRAWNRIEKQGSAPAYLRATVVNLSRSNLRRRLVERRHASSTQAETGTETDQAGRLAVLEALRRLPHGQRSVIVLRYHLDLSEQETARTLGVAQGTVKSQTHRALARLGELLAEQTN
jgi:RNA polymerase sigma-70 factor (sigma-E family)